MKIADSLRVIEDIEADKKGTSQEKHLSAFDKYKIAVKFMQMLQKPEKFAHLERFLKSESNAILMNLKPNDLRDYKELLVQVDKNNNVIEGYRVRRREVVADARDLKGEYGLVDGLFEGGKESGTGKNLNDPALKKL